MILEGVVTTRNAAGEVNIAPMGPIVELPIRSLRFRPFQTSTTYRNLKQTGCGVFHITDDVLLIAQAALGTLLVTPETFPARHIQGDVLADCCRWYEFEVESLDDSQPRTEIVVRVVHDERRRDFIGFNRAKHAVIEAAILATRLHLLPRNEVEIKLRELAIIVDKTAGPAEQEAFEFVSQFVVSHNSQPS